MSPRGKRVFGNNINNDIIRGLILCAVRDQQELGLGNCAPIGIHIATGSLYVYKRTRESSTYTAHTYRTR